MGSTIYDVVRDCVARYAPEELPFVAVLGSMDQELVARSLRQRRRDQQLGFGLTEITAAVTPVVWLALDEAGRMTVRAAIEGTGTRIKAALGRLRRRNRLPAEIPPLSREQLVAVHRRIVAGVLAAGMPESTAHALADHVIARLTLDQLCDGARQ
jgi:hypothetical protein